jgi:elongation factor P
MLNLNEIKLGKILKINDHPCVVIKADRHKMARGGMVLKVKVKSLIDGSVLEKTYQGNDKAEEASTETKKASYLYKDEENAFFMDNDSFEQFSLPFDNIGDKKDFLKEETDVEILYFNDNPVSISLPIKMDFKVVSAPPGVKGNSASNVNKLVKIETGAQILAPLFVNEGDMIKINTDTGEYVERV